MVTREEHTVLGINRIASGREEAFKARAVSSGSNQKGNVLLEVFLRSRPCSDSLSALPMSVYEIWLAPHGPFCRAWNISTLATALISAQSLGISNPPLLPLGSSLVS